MMNEWGRKGLVGLLVLLVFVGVVVAATPVLSVEPTTSLDDPGAPTYMSWDSATTTEATYTNVASHQYLLKIELVQYNGKTGQNAVTEANANSANPITNVSILHSGRGVYEDITHDLLSDGTAYYYDIPQSGNDLTIHIVAEASGNLSLHRAPITAEHISIRTHRQIGTENCGLCHANETPTNVHQGMGATSDTMDDWQDGTCATCHGQTMTDLHTDCDNACHDSGYPINGNGTLHSPDISANGGMMVEGEYYCGDSACHGQESATSSHMSAYSTGQAANYCPACHESYGTYGYPTEFHEQPGMNISDYGQTSSDCPVCHGFSGDDAHRGLQSKNKCGGDNSCHTGGGGKW